MNRRSFFRALAGAPVAVVSGAAAVRALEPPETEGFPKAPVEDGVPFKREGGDFVLRGDDGTELMRLHPTGPIRLRLGSFSGDPHADRTDHGWRDRCRR